MDAKRILWIGSDPSHPELERLNVPDRWTIDAWLPETVLERLPGHRYDVVLLDCPSSSLPSLDYLERLTHLSSPAPLLVRDAAIRLSDPRVGVLSACPVWNPAEDLVPQVERATQGLPHGKAAATEEWQRLLVGDSPPMRQVGHLIRLVGPRRSTVLITGETGTGKEMAAHALHLASPRRKCPWIAVNCSALPENLLEAELFGHVRGAFTGAAQNRTGRFEQAHRGTLFLDEIGDLPMELQAKLLRVLQEREIQRLGSSDTIQLDVRVVAATNCELARRVAEGTFREDLYYRLNVVPLEMPPLRRRREDIPRLATHFVEKICRLEALPVKALRADVLERLCDYAWPGNVRQLENAVEMAVALSGDRTLLMAGDFPPPSSPLRAELAWHANLDTPVVSVPDDGLDYEQTLAVIERSILEQALRKTGGNKKAAAGMLRLKRTTLSAKMRSLDHAACN